jgi:hypothetical protein
MAQQDATEVKQTPDQGMYAEPFCVYVLFACICLTQNIQTRIRECKQCCSFDLVVGDQSLAAQKSGTKKAELKPSEAKKLIEFMEKNYQERVAKVQSFDEFYHAIFELME